MKKKSLTLDSITIKSFVTEADKSKIKGGNEIIATQVGCTHLGLCP